MSTLFCRRPNPYELDWDELEKLEYHDYPEEEKRGDVAAASRTFDGDDPEEEA